jgi:hypothetical protein
MNNIWNNLWEIGEQVKSLLESVDEHEAIVFAYEDYISELENASEFGFDEAIEVANLATDLYEDTLDELEQLKDCVAVECDGIGKCWELK